MWKRRKKDDMRPEVSKYNPVPLYRSYGSTKKEYKWREELLTLLEKVIAIVFLGLIFFTLGISVFSWLRFGGILVHVVVTATIALFLFFVYTKTFRKRLSLSKKLKKVCMENHFDLTFERPVLKSLKWSEKGSDITVVTKNHVFYIHLLAVPKYRCHICFDSASEIRIVKPPLNNKFTVIFDFKAKTKKLSLDFSDTRQFEGKKTHKIILVNPVCGEMYYKISQVSTSQTGNGGEHFGYKIFTASGFVNYLARVDKENAEASKIIH